MNDILEGYYNKQKRENEKVLFNAKMLRRAAFISILPHTKGLTENRFNKEVWPIDEKIDGENELQERANKASKAIKKYQLKLREERLKKQSK